MWVVLRGLHRRLRIVVLSRLMHVVHLLLLVWVPVGGILLGVLWHHSAHLLGVVLLIGMVRPHMRRHRGVGAIMPPLRGLHGHLLPIRHMVLIHLIHGVAATTAGRSRPLLTKAARCCVGYSAVYIRMSQKTSGGRGIARVIACERTWGGGEAQVIGHQLGAVQAFVGRMRVKVQYSGADEDLAAVAE